MSRSAASSSRIGRADRSIRGLLLPLDFASGSSSPCASTRLHGAYGYARGPHRSCAAGASRTCVGVRRVFRTPTHLRYLTTATCS